MPRLAFFLVCGSSSIDTRTNVLSLFNVIEQLSPPAQALQRGPVGANVEAVSLWERQEGEENAHFDHRVKIVSPRGNEVATQDTPFQMDKLRHRVYGQFRGLPIAEAGEYRFNLYLKRREDDVWPDEPLATWHINVKAEA
jgi:hypothetical protein